MLIRKTKFQKTRLVPLHDTAVAGLGRYLMYRQETRCSGDHLFVTEEGKALSRIHDLRHTFAVRALESSPTGRQRIGQHMLALATYLGHVNINATYWYLESTADLLRDIAITTESFALGGRQ